MDGPTDQQTDRESDLEMHVWVYSLVRLGKGKGKGKVAVCIAFLAKHCDTLIVNTSAVSVSRRLPSHEHATLQGLQL